MEYIDKYIWNSKSNRKYLKSICEIYQFKKYTSLFFNYVIVFFNP